jgi:hypothetical protein
MTPKQRYEERKRLRAERLLRQEQLASDYRAKEKDAEEGLQRLMIAFERIADVMELWADQQADTLAPAAEAAPTGERA